MYRNLECILTIYEEGSFSKAADRLFVSQPALSLIVKKTEDELGLSLFNRSSKPIRLTSAGAFYIEFIKKVMEAEKTLDLQLNEIREQEKDRLNIGGSNYFCSYILPTFLHTFKKQYPKYTLNLTEGNPQYLAQLLQNSDLDLTIDVELLDPKQFTSQVWKQEHIILAVPATNPINEELKEYRLTFKEVQNDKFLQAKYQPIELKHFAEQDFFLLKRGNDSYTRSLAMFHNAGIKPHVIMYLDQMMTAYTAAKNGNACTFIRSDIIKYSEPTKKLYFYKINDALATRDIYIYTKKAGLLSKATRRFIDFLLQKGE